MGLINRRRFAVYSGTSLWGTYWLARKVSADELAVIIAGKDPALTLVSRDPLVLETPDEFLRDHRVTPASVLFVRNHHGARSFESMDAAQLEGSLEIDGLVKSPLRIPLDKLLSLDPIEIEMVLQCSGNFRFQFSKFSPIKGTPWNKGGMGNVRFGGVSLRQCFKVFQIDVNPTARYLTAEGADQPENEQQADYAKSIPLEVALERGFLATTLNGEPLPILHGGPLRLIIPGYYGSSQVKWLTKLRLEAAETANHFQIPDYRTPKQMIQPGDKIEYTLENSDPNFGMKINSRLLSLQDGGILAGDQETLLTGVAWNDGAASLNSVEVSWDGGMHWTAARLERPPSPYAFWPWQLGVRLPAGQHEIWVRATDDFGRCQMANGGLAWNPGGYCWNGYDKVAVKVE